MIQVGVIGATGYAGAELVRLLSQHGQVELKVLATRSHAGKPFWEVYPHLYNHIHLVCEEIDVPHLAAQCDVIFTALPHGHAMPVAQEVVQKGKKLIDLGADFRFRQVDIYEQWYQVEHTARDFLPEAIYGLPELFREEIKGARIVANPGCYPTSAILGLAPLLQQQLADLNTIVIDAKSGVSGAGRGLSLNTHYCEINDSIKAYGVATHRHTPEIEQALSRLSGEKVCISFTPHLTPMTRGILSTCYIGLRTTMNQAELMHLYQEFYQEEAFVQVLPQGMLPTTKGVAGSNYCHISPVLDQRTGRVIVLSVIDNLIKGAAGQAVQNMNLLFDFPENTGLTMPGMYP